MISRRNIRVKVMQMIYALESAEDVNIKADPVKTLQQKLNESAALFTYLVYFITEVARYAETDARQRASKNLITADDLNVNTKIAGNTLLWKIIESPDYINAVTEYKPSLIDAESVIRKIYLNLVQSDIYKKYTGIASREYATEKDVLRFIFTDLMLPDEMFTSFLEEFFSNWQDDAEMMQQLMLSYLSKPSGINLSDLVGNEKWQFARQLLTTTIDKKTSITDLIKPKLKNWDADRIAMIDMILMQMGICELLYFETIPPKVTINEYIDIAKEYSTQQSGHFINGILDNIHKELLSQNKILKTDFKQKSNS